MTNKTQFIELSDLLKASLNKNGLNCLPKLPCLRGKSGEHRGDNITMRTVELTYGKIITRSNQISRHK